MSLREWILAGLLAVAAGLVVRGVASFSTGAAWLAAGVAVGVWSWLVLTETHGDR